MAALTCCGNQPTPIIIGLLVTYLTGLIDCYPLSSSSDNINLGKIIYRPNFNSHPPVSSSVSSQLSSSSSKSQTPSADLSSSSSSSSSSSPAQVPISIVSPSSASTYSSPPVASQPSLLHQLPQPVSSYHHPSSSSSSIPGIAFMRGPIVDDDGPIINHRSNYQDYFDTFRLPLMSTGLEKGGGGIGGNNIALMTTNGLTSGTTGIKTPKFILTQPSTSPIDFDYVPYIQSDFNSLQLPTSYSTGSERSGSSSDLYEEADYSEPIYAPKYDPIDDSNWLNEPALSASSSHRQQQPVLPSISLVSSSSPYTSYSPYLTSSSGNSGSSSEEFLTNLMVDYFVKELERNAQQQSLLQSSEPMQQLSRLQQQQHHHHSQQQQPIDELKAYEGYIEKKSSPSSFSRDKDSSSGDKITNNKKETESVSRMEQKGQKEYPMLRPTTENNGKDEMDNQPSLTSQLQSLSSSSSPSNPSSDSPSSNQPVKRADDEVNQLKSLLQSA